jgi:hypothetical protein
MRYLFALFMILNFAASARADDRLCKKECRQVYRTCLDKAEESADDSYLSLDYMSGMRSESLRKLYQHTEDSHKEARNLCRTDQ